MKISPEDGGSFRPQPVSAPAANPEAPAPSNNSPAVPTPAASQPDPAARREALKNVDALFPDSQSKKPDLFSSLARIDAKPATLIEAVNPSARPLQAGGVILQWLGEKANEAASWMDKHSPDLPEAIKPQAGASSAVMGFVGDTLEGIGSLVEWGGKMASGDLHTIQDSAQAVSGVYQSASYADGRIRELSAQVVQEAGEKLNLPVVREVGSQMQEYAQAEQSLASPEAKARVDLLAGTAVHFTAKLSVKEGEVMEAVGQQIGASPLSTLGQQMQEKAMSLQAATENPLVQGIEDKVNERVAEYQSNGSYAVTRDGVRVALEVASLVVGPETFLGKTSTVARVGEEAAELSKVAQQADRLVEASVLLDRGLELEKGAHSLQAIKTEARLVDLVDHSKLAEKAAQDLTEFEVKQGGKARVISDPHGGPKWRESFSEKGQQLFTREVEGPGGIWTESIQGSERVMSPPNQGNSAFFLADRSQVRTLQLPGVDGPLSVKVTGKLEPGQLHALESVLNEMPPAARKNATQIFAVDTLGYVTDLNGANPKYVKGLVEGREVYLSSAAFQDPEMLRKTLYHEAGHVLDHPPEGGAFKSEAGLWGQGKSVTSYGALSASEDFAETHRVVLEQWNRLSQLGPSQWAQEILGDKLRAIFSLYAH